jgi:zinc protease
VIKGGHLLDTPELSGTASLLAAMMTEGTESKTPEELEEAIDMLGARISVYGGEQSISINVNTLTRNFGKTVDLVEEILMEPRWDSVQFDLAKSRYINNIKRNQANPNYLAYTTFDKLVFGEGNLLAIPANGTLETIESITMEDLKDYYASYLSPSVSSLHVVGNIPLGDIEHAFQGIIDRWEPKEVVLPEIEIPGNPDTPAIYFVDVPGAKQSVIQIGNLSPVRTDPDYDAIQTMNYKLGGSFSGVLNMILREEKGFTYGARSNFSGNNLYGMFTASSSVRSNSTLESMEIFKGEMLKYREGVSQEDLAFTKNALMKSNAREFETMYSRLGMLEEISMYGLPFDYIAKQQEVTGAMTLEQHKQLAQKYIQPDKMYYVVVGDAATQLEPLKSLGLGNPVLVED